jgi:indolepyruvate ferredoxin oxidoreductase
LVASGEDAELTRVVAHRVAELVAYQDAAYAERYAHVVERVRAREVEVTGAPGGVARGVARNLYKLMAYKDEYEVARLSLDPALERAVHAQFGAGARYSFRLHPPVLRALGMDRKLDLGTWSKPVLRALYKTRGLRGTPLDPFGRARVRVVERALIEEYIEAITTATTTLTPANHATVAEIAELPDMVRGYEAVKLANVTAYRARLVELLHQL